MSLTKRGDEVKHNESCFYCGNPNPISGHLASREDVKIFHAAFNLLISVLGKKGSTWSYEIFRSPKTIKCTYCNKEYRVLCDPCTIEDCKKFVYQILKKVPLPDREKDAEVIRFMKNENLKPEDVVKELVAFTEIHKNGTTQFNVIFSKYFLSLKRKDPANVEVSDIQFLEKEVGGGGFLAGQF